MHKAAFKTISGPHCELFVSEIILDAAMHSKSVYNALLNFV